MLEKNNNKMIKNKNESISEFRVRETIVRIYIGKVVFNQFE